MSTPRMVTALLVSLLIGVAAASAPPARATCSGTSCLPGSGYTWDGYWNCGPFYGAGIQVCYQPGNCLAEVCANLHTFGWGSADYDGSGDGVRVGIYAVRYGGIYFFSEGPSLARACFYNSCNDQNQTNMYMFVTHNHTHRHTIYGHGKA